MEVKGLKTLSEVFRAPVEGDPESYFCVPRFQRKFDWDKERDVARLVDDIFDDLERKAFMGTLLLRPHSEKRIMEIIDGQQRLATFAIFYRVFVDYSKRRMQDTGLTETQHEQINEMRHDMKRTIIHAFIQEPVIRLATRIDDFFKTEIILSDDENKIETLLPKTRGQHQSIKRLVAAYLKIFETLEEQWGELQGQELVDKLKKIVGALNFRQTFLVLTVEDEADAYTIFETINERGKRLSLNDLMKNLCFRKMQDLGEEELETFASKWDEAEETLVSDFGSFLWHVWVSRNETCSKNKVFQRISDSISQMDSGEVFDLAWAMIFEEANWYYIYGHPNEDACEDEYTKKNMRNYDTLLSIGASRCYPLLLSIDYAMLKKGIITPAQAHAIISTITALTFWHSGICEKDAKYLEKIYHNLAKKLRETPKEKADHFVLEIIATLRSEFPSFDDCSHNFKTGTFSGTIFIKGLLRKLELQRTIEKITTEGEKLLRSNSEVWLEHILPQNLDIGSEWIKIFPDERVREEYCYRLGNQTLLLSTLDQKAQNKPFEDKKEKWYSKSQIELTKDLLDIERWDVGKIDERTEQLFNLAQKEWPISQAY